MDKHENNELTNSIINYVNQPPKKIIEKKENSSNS